MPEASNITMCDQKEHDGTTCKETAALSYRWPWGVAGVCCQKHAMLLQQTAGNLQREISVVPISGAAQAAPLERSERTALIAAKLSAEAEADDLKARGAELYKQNVELTRQVQLLTLKNREANAALDLKDRKLEQLQEKLDEKTVDLGTVTEELQRLQLLAPFATEDTQPSGAITG